MSLPKDTGQVMGDRDQQTLSPTPIAQSPSPKNDTPLMRQYHALKSKNPDALLFFRLGDFYELFFEDARQAAPILEVVLTQRQGIPMCGVPHHALPGYLAKLLKRGFRAAIAEQMEESAATTALAGSAAGERPKGMVSRDVVRVVTPGTVLEEELLPAKQNNFLLAVYPANRGQGSGVRGRNKDTSPSPITHPPSPASWGLAALDISTGELLLTEINGGPSLRGLSDEISRLNPREILHPRSAPLSLSLPQTLTAVDDRCFLAEEAVRRLTRAFDVHSLTGYGLEDGHPSLSAAAAVLNYVADTQPAALPTLKPPRVYRTNDFLLLDETVLRHLDLLPAEKNSRDAGARSLWDVLDHTVTPMGGRRLRWWMLHPLMSAAEIARRQDRVEFLLERVHLRASLKDALKEVADVERILGRLAGGGATGRDLNALRRTLRKLPDLREIFSEKNFLSVAEHPLRSVLELLSAPPTLVKLLEDSLAEDPPLRLSDGGVLKDGFSAALDEFRQLAKSGRSWISELETQERARTGIGSLKVGYTSVFGYYLEVSRANLTKVPSEWIRKQTLANAERFITPELKAMEDKVLGAEEKAKALEAELFAEVRAGVLKERAALSALSEALSDLDATASLAEAAATGAYARPKVTEGSVLRFDKARHPVVELALAQNAKSGFVPNDTLLDAMDNQIGVVTGPNMAGKSTYLRQVALLTIMAQMGSFIPAESAEVGVVDRIFTRIGAGDNLAAGASTFLVEMQEVSNILHNATPRSLVILDEVGRGTSTYDGVAVAWAVVEYLHRPGGKEGPKVLFATHYFELTELPELLRGVKNFHAAVREWTRPDGKTELVFLHEIRPGPADRSYGVHVAQMAGLPLSCVKRARTLLRELEKGAQKASLHEAENDTAPQLDFFKPHPALQELEALDPNTLTPMEALQLLHRWTQDLRNDQGKKGG